MDSILTSVKKLLGIEEDYEQFDIDLIIHINLVFSVLCQLGVGPSKGFSISSKSDEWTDFVSDENRVEMLKTYMYMRVRLLFDPPTSGGVIEVYNNQIREMEWRLTTTMDAINAEEEEEDE